MEKQNKGQINEVVEGFPNSESMQGYEFVFDPETLEFVKRPCLYNEPGEIITEMTIDEDWW